VCRAAEEACQTGVQAVGPGRGLELLAAPARAGNLPALRILESIITSLADKQVVQLAARLAEVLLAAYSSPQSRVRQAAVAALATLHSLAGESLLSPHLISLPPHKRKLVSLYILRQRQRTGRL